ncbi:hypothetical protein [Carboxylicivirga sp. RSCT41]|uniref:hypothetical protein n=1 Tax=Carboxylicivirga agarovorans TaxID=3417570 RepID=UPI003D356F06
MARYTSNNYFLLGKILSLVALTIIAGILSYWTENTTVHWVGGTIVVLLLLLLAWLMSKLFYVELNDQAMIVKHLIAQKETKIAYHDIIELEHQFRYPVYSRNRIKYRTNWAHQDKSLEFTCVVTQ